MKIAIASGKGGTGKTLVATNLAAALGRAAYVDCDVEGANGHLFLKPTIRDQRAAEVPVPEATDACTGCGLSAKVCRFGAMAALGVGAACTGYARVRRQTCGTRPATLYLPPCRRGAWPGIAAALSNGHLQQKAALAPYTIENNNNSEVSAWSR